MSAPLRRRVPDPDAPRSRGTDRRASPPLPGAGAALARDAQPPAGLDARRDRRSRRCRRCPSGRSASRPERRLGEGRPPARPTLRRRHGSGARAPGPAAEARRRRRAATEQAGEDVADVAVEVRRTRHCRPRSARPPPKSCANASGSKPFGHAVRPHGRVLEAVVFLPLLLVAEHRVRLVDLLEALGLLLVVAGDVRVVLLGQLAVGLLDRRLVGVLGDAQRLVEVFHLSGLIGHDTAAGAGRSGLRVERSSCVGAVAASGRGWCRRDRTRP